MTNDPMRQAPAGAQGNGGWETDSEGMKGDQGIPAAGGSAILRSTLWTRVRRPDFKGSGKHLGVPQNELGADGTTTAQKSQT